MTSRLGREEIATPASPGALNRANAWKYLLLFLAACAFFFLSSSRLVNIYDEGIVLTGAMRVMAGQVPYRDFYFIYGPAYLYLLAGLFKLFGASVLVERLLDVFGNACMVTLMYGMARRLCSRPVAAGAAILCAMWGFGIGMWYGIIVPVSVLTLWTTWLMVPVFQRDLTARRMAAAGLLVVLSQMGRKMED